MKKITALVMLLLVLVGAQSAYAGDCCKLQDSPWTQEETYKGKVVGKLDFAMKNVLAGWTDIFAKPYQAIKNDCCIIKGTFCGIVHGITNEVGGALHLVTFPIPVDVKLPNGGVLNGCECCSGDGGGCPMKK